MANKLYNGVSLPALPAYDTSAFPYAYISKNTAGTAYILVVAEERPVYGVSPEDSTVTGVYHYGLSSSYLVDGEAWVLQVEADSFVCTADSIGSVIWTNTDILKSDGSVYLAGSEPVGTADWLKSFKMGLALGLCGKPLPLKREQWETLLEATLTTEENNSVNGAVFTASLNNYGGSKFYAGETIRLTVDGVSTVFTAIGDGTTACVGNEWLSTIRTATGVEDTGYDYHFSNSTTFLSSFWFHSRAVGTYSVKVERLQSGE